MRESQSAEETQRMREIRKPNLKQRVRKELEDVEAGIDDLKKDGVTLTEDNLSMLKVLEARKAYLLQKIKNLDLEKRIGEPRDEPKIV